MVGRNKGVVKCVGMILSMIEETAMFKLFLAMKKTMMGGVSKSGVRDTGR